MRLIIILLALFIGSFFLFSGNSLFLNSTNIILNKKELNEITIGLINSCYFFGAIISSITAHKVISRVGHNRSFSCFAAIMGITVLIHSVTFHTSSWAILRIVQGFAYYGILMVIESWLNEKSEASFRSRILGTYEAVFFIAFSFGALLLNQLEQFDSTVILSAILIIIAILPLSLTKMPAPDIPKPEKISIPNVFNLAPLALIGSFIGGFLANGFITMSAIYILGQDYSIKEASYFIAFSMLGGFLIQYPIGKFSDSIGRREAIMFSSILTFISIIISWFFIKNINIQYIIAFFIGCGAFPIYSLSLARANDMIGENSPLSIMEVSRSMLFTYGFGSLIAPFSFGIFLHTFKAYGFGILFALLSAILFFFALKQRHIPKEKRKKALVATVPSSATNLINSSTLDTDDIH